jgi:hypothetical protein
MQEKGAAAPLRCHGKSDMSCHKHAPEDVAYNLAIDSVTNIVNGAGDSVVDPCGILLGQPDDEFFQFRFDRRSSELLAKP